MLKSIYYSSFLFCILIVFAFSANFIDTTAFAATTVTNCSSYKCDDCYTNPLGEEVCTRITVNAPAGQSFGVLNCTPPTFNTFCDRTNWWFYRNPTCKQVTYPKCNSEDKLDNPIAVFDSNDCDWQHDECNAADRCYGATTAGTGSGSDAAGRVVPGKCDEQLGCISGTSQYKQCCSAGGLIPTTSCVDGTCPQGQITGVNVISCILPDCNQTPSSCGSCNYKAGMDNTCSSNNGTKSCTYTTYNGSTNCKPTTANIDCDKDCTSGTCNPVTGICTQNSSPSPSPSPSPASSPSPSPPPAVYSCGVNQATNITASSADVNISQQNNSSGLNYNRTWWSLDGNYRGYTDDSGGNPQPALFRALLSNHNYSVGATRISTTNGATLSKDCSGNEFTTKPPPAVIWNGDCTGPTAFSITGNSSIYTYAKRDDNGNFIWQGEKPPKTLTVPSDVYFSWYSQDPGGNQPRGTAKICYSNSAPPPPPQDPPPYTPPTEREGGMPVYLKYPDGTVYDGFKAPTIPVYSWEDGYSAYPTASALTNLDNTSYTLSCPVSPWQSGVCSYGSQCAYRYWKKANYSFFDVVYNSGWCESVGGCDSAKGSCFKRWVAFQFPSDFSLSASLNPASDGGGVVAYNSGGVIKMWAGGVASLAWHPVWDLTVRPPVTLTIIKLGQGTVTGNAINNLETFTKTREGWNGSSDPQTLVGTCSPGNVITSYTSTYGNGANGNPSGGDCWNPVSACGSCIPGSSSCSVTYNHTNCGHDDAWYCADAKLIINCAPPGVSSSTTSQTYYKTSLTPTNNTIITLTAAPGSGYVFAGWDSGCYEINGDTCKVLMDNNKTVTANFTLPAKTLTVKKAGAGDGNVSSNPAGISYCSSPSGCSASFAHGTIVTLTPNYNNIYSIFTGWSEGCSGIGTCQVAMDQNRSVTATFTQPVCSYLKTVGGDVYSGTGINMSCSQE